MNAIILWYMYRHTISIFFVTNAARYFPQVSIIHGTCIPQRNIYDNYWNTILFSIMKIGYLYTSAGNYRSSFQWTITESVPLICRKAILPVGTPPSKHSIRASMPQSRSDSSLKIQLPLSPKLFILLRTQSFEFSSIQPLLSSWMARSQSLLFLIPLEFNFRQHFLCGFRKSASKFTHFIPH